MTIDVIIYAFFEVLMKKVIICVILCLFMSGCAFNPIEATTVYESPYATDVDGNLVPVHENVEESIFSSELFSFDEKGRVKYEDSTVKLLHGIDVSVFQGDIDWSAVKNDGIDFVFLRIGFRGYGTKGIMQIDENFYNNYASAKEAGLKVGVYFYSQALNSTEAIEEADFVLDTLGGRALDFPVAYDWEYVDNVNARTKNMTSEAITECAYAFCEHIEKNGYKSIIYFNCEIGYFEYDLSYVDSFDFWLAEYNTYPTFIYNYKLWQYTDKGSVEGIDGYVDLNISVVDYSENFKYYG